MYMVCGNIWTSVFNDQWIERIGQNRMKDQRFQCLFLLMHNAVGGGSGLWMTPAGTSAPPAGLAFFFGFFFFFLAGSPGVSGEEICKLEKVSMGEILIQPNPVLSAPHRLDLLGMFMNRDTRFGLENGFEDLDGVACGRSGVAHCILPMKLMKQTRK